MYVKMVGFLKDDGGIYPSKLGLCVDGSSSQMCFVGMFGIFIVVSF